MFEPFSLNNSYLLQVDLALLVTLYPLHSLWLPQLIFSIEALWLLLSPVIRANLLSLVLWGWIVSVIIGHGLAIVPAQIQSFVWILFSTRGCICFVAWWGLSSIFFGLSNRSKFFLRELGQFNQFLGRIKFQLEVALCHRDNLICNILLDKGIDSFGLKRLFIISWCTGPNSFLNLVSWA